MATAATAATAHEIARICYSLLTRGGEYEERGTKSYDQKQHERMAKSLRTRAGTLAYELVEKAA